MDSTLRLVISFIHEKTVTVNASASSTINEVLLENSIIPKENTEIIAVCKGAVLSPYFSLGFQRIHDMSRIVLVKRKMKSDIINGDHQKYSIYEIRRNEEARISDRVLDSIEMEPRFNRIMTSFLDDKMDNEESEHDAKITNLDYSPSISTCPLPDCYDPVEKANVELWKKIQRYESQFEDFDPNYEPFSL